jgi:hypothetical protein
MDRASDLPLSPLDSPTRSPVVSLWFASSDLKDRIDLGVQVLRLGERFCKGNSTETSDDLNLPGALSEIGGLDS